MSPTLLLADDSVTIQRVVELTFANEDVRVVATSDGLAAVQRMDAEPPDIVLADVGMPKMDGYEVSKYVKNHPALKAIPVVLLTGAFEPIDEDKARASGCDGILVKPFEPQQLVARVQELLAGTHTSDLWPSQLPRIEPIRSPAPAPPPPPAPPSAPVAVERGVALRAAPPALPAPPPMDPVMAPEAADEMMPNSSPVRPSGSADSDGMPASLKREFDQLDAAFAQLDPDAPAGKLDRQTVSDFARDLDMFRSNGEPDAPSRSFGDWDLPAPPPQPEAEAPPSPISPIAPMSMSDWGMESLEQPPAQTRPARLPPATTRPSLPAPVAGVPAEKANEPASFMSSGPTVEAPSLFAEKPSSAPKFSMASAFTALLAAEQSQPVRGSRPAEPSLSEATIDDVVRRVLARITDDVIHELLIETTERIVREELAKTRPTPM
jgi:CheY-like chemotaxis protein